MTEPTEENDARPTFYYCFLVAVVQPGYPGDAREALQDFSDFLHKNQRVRPEHGYSQPYMDCFILERAAEHSNDTNSHNWCERYSYCERFYDFANSEITYSDAYNCDAIMCTWDSNDACIKCFKPVQFIENLSLVFPDLVFILDMAHDTDEGNAGKYYFCGGRYTFRPAAYCLLPWWIDNSKLLKPLKDIKSLPESKIGQAFLSNLIAEDGDPLCMYSPAISEKINFKPI